jgi:very-short-patch-repair endonuclease
MHPALIAVMDRQSGVFTRQQARDVGYSNDEIRHLQRRGEWLTVRRGALTTAERREAASGRTAGHLLRAAAALLTLGCDPVLSHRSAALAWDLPLVGELPEDVEITTDRQNRRRTPGLAVHTARTPPHHRGVAGGLAVTSVARTVSDIARSSTFAAATVLADAALHRGLCAPADLDRVIRDCWVWRGIVRTKKVLAFADALSESPGESLSRVAMTQHGLPEPVLQGQLVLEGREVRVDFLWPDRRVVGEFDGRVKYAERDSLWREKDREDLIRRSGYRVVRWVWSDVFPDPRRLVTRLGSVLDGQG